MTTPNGNGTNLIGLLKDDYKGAPSSLCPGCGHNSVSQQIIAASYEYGLAPEQVIKFSGIGCSSKSPAYFMSRSFAFNSLHGRMPSVATGALLANRNMIGIAVSGDGDTASIGFGQFKHLLRRNLPLVYIIENNGVYGLTKGQFSATSDLGQEGKSNGRNTLPPIDLCLESIIGGAGFVARSFAGDVKQVKELIKAALAFNGTAVIDIVSPCVSFNNRSTSTKSFAWSKENEQPLHELRFVPGASEIEVDYAPGTEQIVTLHDGAKIALSKLARDYDPTDRMTAIAMLEQARIDRVFTTGLIYFQPDRPDYRALETLPDVPLNALGDDSLRPSRARFDALMDSIVLR